MTTGHLVDPELDAFLDQLPTIPMTAETLPQIRAALNEMLTKQAAAVPGSPDIEVREQFVPGPEGAPNVRVLAIFPKQPHGRCLGSCGFMAGDVIGTPEGDDARAKQIVQEVGCAVVSVDYRLSPETPFPGGVEDCYAALKWLQGQAGELGVDSGRLAIGGASAGGGLAAALGLLTRDRAEVPLAFQLLIFPMLDDRTTTTADPHPYTGEFVWRPQHNHFAWPAPQAGSRAAREVSPYAAAARAPNPEGLPPTVSVGSTRPLCRGGSWSTPAVWSGLAYRPGFTSIPAPIMGMLASAQRMDDPGGGAQFPGCVAPRSAATHCRRWLRR